MSLILRNTSRLVSLSGRLATQIRYHGDHEHDHGDHDHDHHDDKHEKAKKRVAELDKKTPKGKFDASEYDPAPKAYDEKEPLEAFPNNINPKTGEIGGPRGPEPTRFGDWERKGRCTDF
jgi:hypothetical protein